MTDKNMADKIYIEPLTKNNRKNIRNRKTRQHTSQTLEGQTGLNIAMELYEDGF